MPNIMLTYRCNLHCSYCFANEFVNKENTDITVRNFIKAVDFLTAAGKTSIGLIGGEPTLHPVFQLLMEMLINNPKVSKIVLYTNGLLMNQYIPQITHPKVAVLVNCNSPAVIGERAFSAMRDNLDTLIWKYYKRDSIHLGINLFSDDLDYSYVLDMLQHYKLNSLRISVTVPDFSSGSKTEPLEYFAKRYTELAKEKLSTDILDPQLAYSIRFYCMGAVGMTQEWVLNDNITSAETVVQMMFNSMPENLRKIFF